MSGWSADSDTVRLSRQLLQGSSRVEREGTPLLRSNASGQPENPVIEVPLPLADVARPSHIRVLHVDDDPDLGEVTSMFLEQVNDDFEVATEPTVVAALDRLKSEDFDCVVSDYQMPSTDGLEFLDIVREQYPDMPFILFTGRGSEEIASDAIAAGVTDYMQKDSGSDTYEVLANRIENAVEQYLTQEQFWTALSWYQRLVEQELAGVFIVQNEEFVYVNKKLADVFGRDQHQLVGEPPTKLVPAADRDRIRDSIGAPMESEGDTVEFDVTGKRADGSTFPVGRRDHLRRGTRLDRDPQRSD
ncbi:MAG: response regulator [Haloarculaceae archaeon]